MNFLLILGLTIFSGVLGGRVCNPDCPDNFTETPTQIAFSSHDMSPGEEICQLVNQFRAENGLNSLSYSIALAYVAETHYLNLLDFEHNYFNQTCNMHSWYPIPSKGINFCCYPTGRCMSNKARRLTSDWSGSYTPVTFTAIENAAFQQTSGISPATPNDFVEQWKASPGHRAAMLFGDLKSCGANLNFTTESNFFGTKTDAVSLLWMGRGIDPNPSSLVLPSIPQPGPSPIVTPSPPTGMPPTSQPTPQPTNIPSHPPTGMPTGGSACEILANHCWNQCGRPAVFPFRETCSMNFDMTIKECTVPPNCVCQVPDELRTQIDWLESPTSCNQGSCNVNWGNLFEGSLKWCTACGYDCDGFQQDCINNSGFCRLTSRCAGLKMCEQWQIQQCESGNQITPFDYQCPTEAPTPQPTPPPTNIPTPHPTRRPTQPPTFPPTNMPTGTSQTNMPTVQPTDIPTDMPIDPGIPTQEPTIQPSDMPTLAPAPSDMPPSDMPTPMPTDETSLSFEGVVAGFAALILFVLVLVGLVIFIVWFYQKKLINLGAWIQGTSEQVLESGSDLEAGVNENFEVFGRYLDGDEEPEDSDDDDRNLLIKQGRFRKTGKRTTRKKIAKMENQIELKDLDKPSLNNQ